MKDRWKSLSLPLCLGLMSALPLAGTLMGLLGFDDAFLPATCAIAVLVAVTIGVDVLSPSKLLSKGMALVLPVAWLVGWGIPLLGEIPALLHACASQAGFVLRLYAAPITALIAVLAVWLGRSVTKEYGAALMTSMAAACGVLLWILDQEALLWRLLPLLMTTLLLLMKGGVQPANARRTMSLVALVVGVSFLFTLGGNVTVASLKENADSLRQKILDYFFFTDARNVFSLSTEGYYPQGLSQLGGAATPDEDPVMLVSTPEKTYLRAITKDEYTGRNWRDNLGGRRYQWQASRWENQRTEIFDLERPAGRAGASSLLLPATVRVQMVQGSASSLFVPQRLRSLTVSGDMVPYFNGSSEVFITRDLVSGDLYELEAVLLTAGEAGIPELLAACNNGSDNRYGQMREIYTKLPTHLESYLYDMAADMTAGAETPYERAMAILHELHRGYRYNLEVAPQQGNMDFVSTFLMQTREGYCTHFASAMTVLCRMVGLPARYVEGYVAVPDSNGNALVTGKQGHAWTEVYFEGFGWLTFDPTPTQEHMQAPPEQEEQDPPESPLEPENNTPPEAPESPETPPEEESPTPSEEDVPQPEAQKSNLSWLWWLLALLLLAGAGLRIWWILPQQQEKRCTQEQAQFAVWMQAIHDVLLVHGQKPESNESPTAFLQRVDKAGLFPVSLLPMGKVASMVAYGKINPTQEEMAEARQAFRAIMGATKGYRQAAVWLLRGVVPLKRRSYTKR